jgi:hypothetical protein
MRIFLSLVVIALVVAAAFWLLLPGGSDSGDSTPAMPVETTTPSGPEDRGVITEEERAAFEVERDKRLVAMQEAYAGVERERDALRQDLTRAQRDLAAADIDAKRKRDLAQELGRLSFYVHTPKLLGAFVDVNAIRNYEQELKRGRARLESIEAELGAAPAP